MAKISNKVKKVLELNNIALDGVVGLQGTKYDRRRKVDSRLAYDITRMAGHKSMKEVADWYGVSVPTVKAVLDPEFAESEKARKRAVYAKYKYKTDSDIALVEERGQYKRELLEAGKRLPIKG